MKTETLTGSGQGIVSMGLALVAALLILGVLTNQNLPLIDNSRGALAALAVLGFIMCATGGLANKVGRTGFSWSSHFVILGILLEVSAVYVAFPG